MELRERLETFRTLLADFGVETVREIIEPLQRVTDPADYPVVWAASLPANAAVDPDGLEALCRSVDQATAAIGRLREIRWKPFQYVALVFCQRALEHWFTDPTGPSKLALWTATGSGKTLLMHANIAQFQALARRAEQPPDRVLLITPSAGLTDQHIDDLRESGFRAGRLDPNAHTLFRPAIEVLEISKLGDADGREVVDARSFAGRNLVLVDEGHRGATGDVWRERRDILAEGGLCLEYSATFGQAAAGNDALLDEYGEAIIFDYSYPHFYADGYGKEYQILNRTSEDGTPAAAFLYQCACLLTWYEQMHRYRALTERERLQFGFERPLLLLVGWSVNPVRRARGQRVSDVLDMLFFLAEILGNPGRTIAAFERLIEGRADILDGRRDLFANSFGWLREQRVSGAGAYQALCEDALHGRGRLRVERLRGHEEIHLLAGASERPFGLVYVGDTGTFFNLCMARAEAAFEVDERFGSPLFGGVKKEDSDVNILIGARKFVEGWSSYRVTAMGLLNMARSEGAQAIQLFGRGVRLRGQNFSLRRSSREPRGAPPPRHIGLLETLSIFAVNATYLADFRSYLSMEMGGQNVEIVDRVQLPVRVRADLGTLRLKTLRIQGGSFEAGGAPFRLKVEPGLRVSVNAYARVNSILSEGYAGDGPDQADQRIDLLPVRGWLDTDALWHRVVATKRQAGMQLLRVARHDIEELLLSSDWYEIKAPRALVRDVEDLGIVDLWQELAGQLLDKYVKKLYLHRQQSWEVPRRQVVQLDDTASNLRVVSSPDAVQEYEVQVTPDAATWVTRLRDLRERLEADHFDAFTFQNGRFHAWGDQLHLFRPLVYCQIPGLSLRPQSLNSGERDFIASLDAYWRNQQDYPGYALYTLRNRPQVGVGFAEAGNFYPDFIVWLVAPDGHQYVTFVDPKGLLMLLQPDHPKIQLHTLLPEWGARHGPADCTLSAFLLSVTRFADVDWIDPLTGARITQRGLNERGILEMASGPDPAVIGEMLARAVQGRGTSGFRERL